MFACAMFCFALAITQLLNSSAAGCEQVEYRLPEHASNTSPEALDLLQHILVEDPARRYSLGDMQKHPWSAPALINIPLALLALSKEALSEVHTDEQISSLSNIYCRQCSKDV